MTSIGSTGSYAPSYAAIITAAQGKTGTASSGTASSQSGASNSATTVTLSEAAKAALTLKDFAAVIADARTNMDKLLAEAQRNSPLTEAGGLAIDLGKADRRELFAISSNAEQKFTTEEQKAAQIELQRRFDQALAGPTSVGRVTGKVDGLYAAALAFYDAAGPEEKASAAHVEGRKAIEQMIAALRTNPATLPGTFAGDPVNIYMERLAAGETGELRAIADVGADARTTLDAQYAAGGTLPDYRDFDSRSLAAVALNTGDDFSADEVRMAKQAMKTRSGAALLAALKASDAVNNPAGFSENVISMFGAMSAEERAAAGWSDNLYAAAVASYQSASKLASMLGTATGSSLWGGTGDGGSASGSGDRMSLLSYM